MTPERLRTIERLFHEARELQVAARSGFLQRACAGDAALQAEVESLLAQPPDGLLYRHADSLARALLPSSAARLAPGAVLGSYRIEGLIDAGGMGEVYRAHDTTLGRDVAIKILPQPFMADAERLSRFEREARMLAALNHPSIASIYGVVEGEGVRGLVLELVPGQPLADLVAASGFPIERLLRIAIAICEAVAAAHEGIVHRDLKPANIMVAGADRVKVLDFGLAKLYRPDVAPPEATALATEPLTATASIVGTLPYMSPEQVEGKSADQRSDIFALGVILYELATGRRPFSGGTHAALISSILKDTPPTASDIRADVPRGLARIIQRCLAKDPERRYQTAIDLRNDLTEVKEDLSSSIRSDSSRSPSNAPPRRRPRWTAAVAVAGVVVAAAGAFLFWPARRSTSVFDSKNVAFEQLTTEAGVQQYPSLSPDGKWVVYESRRSGNSDIYLQAVGGQNAIDLTKDSADDDVEPAFSPDGERIAFRSERAGGGIFVMGRTGESVRRLADGGYNPAWSPDGSRIVYATDNSTVLDRAVQSELWTVDVSTGERRRIYVGDAVQPSWSPHGLRIAFWSALDNASAQRDIRTIPADGGSAVSVTSDPAVDWSPVWSPDGHFLYFASNRAGPMNLWRVRIDERTGRPTGSLEAVNAPSASAAQMSLSADGREAVYTAFGDSEKIQRVGFDPATITTSGTPGTVLASSRSFTRPSPSPDGQWLAFQSRVPQMDIFVSRADGSGIRQLTNDRANDRNPAFSPDGSEIAFMSNRDGKNQLWAIRADGSGLRRLTGADNGAQSHVEWSPDGSRMSFTSTVGEKSLFVFDPRKTWSDQRIEKRSSIVEKGLEFVAHTWSPDGAQLAGVASPPDKGPGYLYVLSITSGHYTRMYDSAAVEENPLWLNDSRHILFQERSHMKVIDIRTHAVRDLMSIEPDTMEMWSIARDNKTVYFVRGVSQSDIWLMRMR